MKMDQKDIDELIGKFKDSGLGVMEYEEDGFRFRIEKEPAVVVAPAVQTGANVAMVGAAAPIQMQQAAVSGAGVNGAGADMAGANGFGAGAGANGAGGAVSNAGANGAGAEAGAEASAETIDSPIVGVFYQAPAPGEEPFVKEGDRVSKGDVVCVVEAMKVMNEIRASYDCRILKVLAADGGMVEFGSALFEVEKC
jgi:acetyl-CoA carboxylase biotin carboxyl carrier protein